METSATAAWASGRAPGWYEHGGGWRYFDGYHFSEPFAAPGPTWGDLGAPEAARGPEESSARSLGAARRLLVAAGVLVVVGLVTFGVWAGAVAPRGGGEEAAIWAACRRAALEQLELGGGVLVEGYSSSEVLVRAVPGEAGTWRVRSFVAQPQGRSRFMCVVSSAADGYHVESVSFE